MKPLLAHTIEDTAKIKYPVYVSVKLDGIRCLIIDGVAVSRSLKPIKNKYIQSRIGKPQYNGLDGEIIVGDILAEDCYRVTNSGVMSSDGEPDFTYHVFDRWDRDHLGFSGRLSSLDDCANEFITVVNHELVDDEKEILAMERVWLTMGAEGLMVRSPDGPYKQGRSTLKEGTLGKLKRFVDSEYRVVGFEERMHNANEATVNALGHTERSSHKENKSGRGDLGALILTTEDGLEFNCGTGFDDATRREIWDNRDQYMGQFAKIKSFLIGVKDKPRFPVFLGFRNISDMSS